MKKKIAILLALLLLCFCTAAYAATVTIVEDDEIKVEISAADIKTYEKITKVGYAADMNFALRVKITVPKWASTKDLELHVAKQGIEYKDAPNIPLATGEYIVEGMIVSFPACFQIQIADKAAENAETAEELLNAAKAGDRSRIFNYHFNDVNAGKNGQNVAGNIHIPKTGDISVLPYALSISLITFGLVCAGKRRR